MTKGFSIIMPSPLRGDCRLFDCRRRRPRGVSAVALSPLSRLIKGMIALYLVTGALFAGAEENPAFVQWETGYTVGDSVDNNGNLYIQAWSRLPTVLTFVNPDGSITVSSSDTETKTTHIYEYDVNHTGRPALTIPNPLGRLGAFTKDSDGNYYFFYAVAGGAQSENMVMLKVNPQGETVNTFRLKSRPPASFGGIRVPFDAGTCRLELSGSMLAVYFAREMFNGHQASYGFVLDKDSFERIDTGAATNAGTTGGNTQMPYTSHSFNQFILPVENGFIFADHGDAYPRSFTFAKFIKGSNTRRKHAFRFPGGVGSNPTYAELGGLAKTESGFIFAGAYGKDRNNPRNIFILTLDEELSAVSAPVYLTGYTKDDGHAGHPKIAAIGGGRYLLLWERFSFSTQSANSIVRSRTGYLSTHALIINEKGEALTETRELQGRPAIFSVTEENGQVTISMNVDENGNTVPVPGQYDPIRLNMNDTLRYNPANGKVYWAINNSSASITLYALDPEAAFSQDQ